MSMIIFQQNRELMVNSHPLRLYIDGVQSEISPDGSSQFTVSPGYHVVWFRCGDMSSNEILVSLGNSEDQCTLSCVIKTASLADFLETTLTGTQTRVRLSLNCVSEASCFHLFARHR